MPHSPANQRPRSTSTLLRRGGLAALIVAVGVHVGFSQSNTPAPRVGQPGKDVIWVPSPQAMIDAMLEMAKVTSADVVMDLGSGDGRVVIAAAKRGAQAVGVEYDPGLVALARRNAVAQGVASTTRFVNADLFTTDLSRATVILLFLRLDLNLKLRPKLLELRPGTRIVSNTFTMGDWEPDDIALVHGDCIDLCSAMLWIVPAHVQGTWRTPDGILTLSQDFQRATGAFRTGAGTISIQNGRIRGDRITFTAGDRNYSGHVGTRMIDGVVRVGGGTMRWTAARLP